MRKLVFDEEIDLYYYRARYYDSELWRFISRDPIWQIDDINLYAYVGNNPVMFTDPMGTDKKAIVTFYVIWGILRAGLWIPKAHAPSEYDWNKLWVLSQQSWAWTPFPYTIEIKDKFKY